MSAVAFRDVARTYGEVVALDGLDLEIAHGELLVVLGPSGCGKSTALRILTGLETPDRGRVEIDGTDVTGVDARHRDVAMVFQSYALYPHMSVAANIESPLVGRRGRDLDRDERHRRVLDAARLLDLETLLDRKPAQLSGGQRQRVALARAMVVEPAVFCLDEPLSNLDAKLRAQTRAELVDLHDRLGSTFVHVTHDQSEAMAMATRIAVLDRGRLQQVGSPREIYLRPANAFVARFVGNPPMNLLPATLDTTDGSPSVLLGPAADSAHGSVRWAAAESWRALGDRRALDLGVRPEDVEMTIGDGPARIRSVEWLGHEQMAAVELGSATVMVRSAGDGDLVAGSRCSLAARAERLHPFDPDSGERLDGAS